jgi:hypothetical protein
MSCSDRARPARSSAGFGYRTGRLGAQPPTRSRHPSQTRARLEAPPIVHLAASGTPAGRSPRVQPAAPEKVAPGGASSAALPPPHEGVALPYNRDPHPLKEAS